MVDIWAGLAATLLVVITTITVSAPQPAPCQHVTYTIYTVSTQYLHSIYTLSTLGAAPPGPPRQRLLQQVRQTLACGQVGSGVTAADINQQLMEIATREQQ